LKYKLKYLNAKKTIKGGMFNYAGISSQPEQKYCEGEEFEVDENDVHYYKCFEPLFEKVKEKNTKCEEDRKASWMPDTRYGDCCGKYKIENYEYFRDEKVIRNCIPSNNKNIENELNLKQKYYNFNLVREIYKLVPADELNDNFDNADLIKYNEKYHNLYIETLQNFNRLIRLYESNHKDAIFKDNNEMVFKMKTEIVDGKEKKGYPWYNKIEDIYNQAIVDSDNYTLGLLREFQELDDNEKDILNKIFSLFFLNKDYNWKNDAQKDHDYVNAHREWMRLKMNPKKGWVKFGLQFAPNPPRAQLSKTTL